MYSYFQLYLRCAAEDPRQHCSFPDDFCACVCVRACVCVSERECVSPPCATILSFCSLSLFLAFSHADAPVAAIDRNHNTGVVPELWINEWMRQWVPFFSSSSSPLEKVKLVKSMWHLTSSSSPVLSAGEKHLDSRIRMKLLIGFGTMEGWWVLLI